MTVNQALINKIQAFLLATRVHKNKKISQKTSLMYDVEYQAPAIKIRDAETESANAKIKDFIKKHRIKSFRDLLFKYIDDQNKKDADVYKQALLDRRLFSKIRSEDDYHPNKRTVIALALALKLDLNQALTLLKAAGYTLSESSNFDLIIVYCVKHNIFGLDDINQILNNFKLKPLGQVS